MDSYFNWFGIPGSVVLTTLLSVFALILAICNPIPLRWVCFAAMLLSSVGDIFLARFNGLDKIFPNYFVIGASFFMAAHLLYVFCYGMKLHSSDGSFWNGGALIAIVLAIITIILLCLIGIRSGNTKTLLLIIIYGFIIFANCATVFSYAWTFRSFTSLIAVIGVVSFILSDLIIGINIVGDIHRYDYLIWWFYPIGQILLIIGVGV